jgi:hypothetical protein
MHAHIRLACAPEQSNLDPLPVKAGKWGLVTPLTCSVTALLGPGGMRACPAGNGKGACACVSRLLTSGFGPSLRVDIGATNEVIGNGVACKQETSVTGLNQIADTQRHALAASGAHHLTHFSTMRENMFEHLLLGQLGAELLARGVEYDELHSSVDREGFDVLLEAGGIARHTQLKVKVAGGARSAVTVSTRLAARPSGCVIWLTYDPLERRFCDIRWLGGMPGQPLPDIGDRKARHSRGNSQGIKAHRPDHRIVPASRFERLDDIAHLTDRLFGMLPTEPLAFLRSRLRPDHCGPDEWMSSVAKGWFSAIPADASWESHGHTLAHLINGYHMLQLINGGERAAFLDHQHRVWRETGSFAGDAITLWITLFLEARADHKGKNDFATSFEPQDQLVQQLRWSLVALENGHA